MFLELFRAIRALALLVPICCVFVLPPESRADDFATDELIVRVGQVGDIDLINTTWGTVVIDSIPSRGIYLLHLTNPAIQDSMAIVLDGVPESDFCDYDYEGQSPEARRQIVIVAIGATGIDVEDQGAMARVRKDEAHAISTGSGARVAVLDTGVDIDHPFLAGRLDLAAGADFVDGDSNPDDAANAIDDDGDGLVDAGAGHGTMVAGIIATVAPDATIIPIRVLDDEGFGTVFRVMKGLYKAEEAGANIINLSLGSQNKSDAIEAVIHELHQRGISIVAAGGNDSTSTVQFPAQESEAIAVTSTDSADVKPPFANYSDDVDLTAPGVGVLSSFRDGGFGLGLGTSFSAPFVAGALALVHEIRPYVTPEVREAWLGDGAVAIDGIPGNAPYADELGDGRIDCLSPLLIAMTATGVPASTPASADDGAISLLHAAPNPARDAAKIHFQLDRHSDARLEIFAVDGRRVHSRALGVLPVGEHAVPFATRDESGSPLASGRYVYRVVTPSGTRSGNFAIVR